MENLPTWLIVVGALGGNNVILAIIGYIIYQARYKAELKKTGADTDKTEVETEKVEIENTEKEIDILAKAQVAAIGAFEDRMALEREKEARARDNSHNQLLLDIADRENKKLEEKFDKAYRELIETQIRDRTCQEEILELKKFKEQQGPINDRLIDFSDRNAQLTALVQEAHHQGYLTDEQLDGVGVVYEKKG